MLCTHDNPILYARFNIPSPCLILTPTPGAALVGIEVMDGFFALDSVPEQFMHSSDVFAIYTSNILAIIAVRSVYILLAHAAEDLPGLDKVRPQGWKDPHSWGAGAGGEQEDETELA